MGNKFLFVEQHNGQFVPVDQNALKEQYEKSTQKVFSGACAGVVAALLEGFVSSQRFNPHFFAFSSLIKSFLPSPSRCIALQIAYERDVEHFFTVFIRERLRISKTGHAESEGFMTNPLVILNEADLNDSQKNMIFLIRPTYHLKVTGRNYIQDHLLCILKLNNHYIFCEPNYGVVVFDNAENMKAWLNDEITHGALGFYSRPVKKSMLLAGNYPESIELKEGLLSVNASFFEYFSYPARSTLQTESELKLHARL